MNGLQRFKRREAMNLYFAKWYGHKKEGLWNVIQVINGQARYFVMLGQLEEADALPFLSHGWIEGNQFTDGEDITPLDDWVKHEGILINF
jgi:hypothetical protein